MKNIYGDEIELQERAAAVGRGYAAAPGTGPEGETCGSCKHRYIRQKAHKYNKCSLMQANWTGGAGTDIKVRSPACSKWEES